MRSLKRVLQDWLEITALANKIVNKDLGVPTIIDEQGKIVLLDTPEGRDIEKSYFEEGIDVSRGYKY